jgi:hypothetical protein
LVFSNICLLRSYNNSCIIDKANDKYVSLIDKSKKTNSRFVILATRVSVSTTPFCDTRLCLVSNVEQCISEEDICDGEKFCDDGTDEIPDYFPTVARCHPSSGMDNASLW